MNVSYDSRLLNLVIFAPLVFAAIIFMLPKNEKVQIRAVTFIAMVLDFALAGWAYLRFAQAPGEFRLEYWTNWVPEIGLGYHVGIDGIAASLVLLTGLLGPLVVLAGWRFVDDKVKEFHIALLVLQTAMMGALCALDILLFYVFFEAMLIPMYLLIGVCSGPAPVGCSMNGKPQAMAATLPTASAMSTKRIAGPLSCAWGMRASFARSPSNVST